MRYGCFCEDMPESLFPALRHEAINRLSPSCSGFLWFLPIGISATCRPTIISPARIVDETELQERTIAQAVKIPLLALSLKDISVV